MQYLLLDKSNFGNDAKADIAFVDCFIHSSTMITGLQWPAQTTDGRIQMSLDHVDDTKWKSIFYEREQMYQL